MKKLLLIGGLIVAVIAAVPALLLANGSMSITTPRMLLNVMGVVSGPEATQEVVQERYQLPAGFTMSLYAGNVSRARFMRFTATGDLLVSRPHEGDIVRLQRDANGDGRHDGMTVVIADLRRPLGMDFKDEWLYIAESNRIGRIQFDSDLGQTHGAYQTVVDGLTDDSNHWSKTIRFGPDGLLYLAQGSSCNICEEEDQRRATMMRFDASGENGRIFATGLRNSAGFDWAPWSGELFATENGRDLMGDDFPPCELNRIEEDGFYGWPWFNADNIADPDMGPDPLAFSRTPTAPAHNFCAHNAPLGMTFLDTPEWPVEYRRAALVALHGSWNRSEPDGYKVVSLHWNEQGIEERDFLSGFNLQGDIIGRPVDVIQGPDGAVYISDDYAGAIYRVSYNPADDDDQQVIADNSSASSALAVSP